MMKKYTIYLLFMAILGCSGNQQPSSSGKEAAEAFCKCYDKVSQEDFVNCQQDVDNQYQGRLNMAELDIYQQQVELCISRYEDKVRNEIENEYERNLKEFQK